MVGNGETTCRCLELSECIRLGLCGALLCGVSFGKHFFGMRCLNKTHF